jgi:hypothetical protein
MIGTIGRAALLALATPFAALAEDGQADPLASGRVLEFSLGLFAPGNGLQDTLTRRNNGTGQLQSTDVLDFGQGGRVALTYSQPWDAGSRLVVGVQGLSASGETRVTMGPASEAFPGSYDAGYSLPAGWYVDSGIETRMAMLSVGREWTTGGAWAFSAGIQGGTASQDMNWLLRAAEGPFTAEGEPWRRLTTRSDNRMLGIYGGVSHYMALGERLGLRLAGRLGLMHNRFDYDYSNLLLPPDITPDLQEISGSSSGTAVSTALSVRLEQGLSDQGTLIFEAGFQAIDGIGNGVDTFLDPDGTRTTAAFGRDRIGGGYVSLGYAIRF